ncbi:hypothetical protein ERY430_40621 [Erythrobacter sp. EC-HK427]|nr:hypothetical protein ERY430_40621 [Erythrobacter sp. EC-HK427]
MGGPLAGRGGAARTRPGMASRKTGTTKFHLKADTAERVDGPSRSTSIEFLAAPLTTTPPIPLAQCQTAGWKERPACLCPG